MFSQSVMEILFVVAFLSLPITVVTGILLVLAKSLVGGAKRTDFVASARSARATS